MMFRHLFFVVILLLAVPSAFAGDGVVALQTAAPSCGDDSGDVYVDCANGTVTDNRTGLVWLKDASCFGLVTWHEAMESVAGLSDLPEDLLIGTQDCGLTDGSSAGEWRLPTVAEWAVMVETAVQLGCVDALLGAPSITNDAGDACWGDGASSFLDIQLPEYWSITTSPTVGVTHAYTRNLFIDVITAADKTVLRYVWPVRGGQ